MEIFKDHFSGHSEQYQTYRPTYPPELFEWLASLVPGHDLAWDCATGNGQAALGLAPFFLRVVATDASARQLAEASPHKHIRYVVAPAERVPLAEASVDLVTVSQALHWLNLPGFYAEVRRVVKPGGIIAATCYELTTISPEIDDIILRYYTQIVGPFWPPERRLVEEGYRTLPFPFDEIAPPAIAMRVHWDLHHLLGYLDTWSASQRYRKQRGRDPRDAIRSDLEAAWGDPEQVREVSWPLSLRIGRVTPNA